MCRELDWMGCKEVILMASLVHFLEVFWQVQKCTGLHHWRSYALPGGTMPL